MIKLMHRSDTLDIPLVEDAGSEGRKEPCPSLSSTLLTIIAIVLFILLIGLIVVAVLISLPDYTEPSSFSTVHDCSDIYDHNFTATSGVYRVTINNKPVNVFCDMDTADGGWTVFQRRIDGSEKFDRNWAEYAQGFGNPAKEYWLGNDNLAAMTKSKNYILRLDLKDFKGRGAYAEYENFKIAGSGEKYKLSIRYDSYFGTAFGDHEDASPDKGLYAANGMMFSTYDQDNDLDGKSNLAVSHHGGWWFGKHDEVSLNGMYPSNDSSKAEFISCMWCFGKREELTALKFTEMKIRPATFEAVDAL